MEEYPSNSHINSKAKKEKPKVEPVVTGKVISRKPPLSRRIAQSIIAEDVPTVGNYLVDDILIPAAKNLLVDMISKGAERTIFGAARRGGSQPRGTVNYTPYNRVTSEPIKRREEAARSASVSRDTHLGEIILESRGEAEVVMEGLMALVDTYDLATIADLKDLLNINANPYTDNAWGWTDLSSASIKLVRDGYLLELPKPKPIK